MGVNFGTLYYILPNSLECFITANYPPLHTKVNLTSDFDQLNLTKNTQTFKCKVEIII